jgi:alpha-mannosidase
VAQAEQSLSPIAKAAKKYTVHCVGHAHIDMNWMWSWPETVAVTNDSFLTVLKLMEEFDDFCFTQSQASVYAIARDYHPEMFEAIRRRIAQGRWEVAAVHWVEGDKNLAAGEALARHLIYTRQFCRDNLGLSPEQVTLDWEPDTFGHAHTIPGILARAGVRHYYMCRGGAFEKPPVFWWRSPDGGKVLVWLESTWYINHMGPHAAHALTASCRKTGLKDWMFVYGVGDHGGGPTRRDLTRMRQMNDWPVFPNFRFATAGSFYDILETGGDRWPTLDRELNYEFTGCYTSQAYIKLFNRRGENLCLEAETAAALASGALGRTYPRQQIREAWIGTLFGHFHDILPGSGVRATREFQSGLFQQTAASTSMIKTHSLRALAAGIDTSFAGDFTPSGDELALGGGAGRGAGWGEISLAGHTADWPRPFVVFNPLAHARTELAQVTVWDPPNTRDIDDIKKRSYVARFPDGKRLPVQTLGAGKDWFHSYIDLGVPVTVGALGHQAFVIEEGPAPADAPAVKLHVGAHGHERQTVGRYALENERLAVSLDPLTGGVSQLLDKSTGRDLADAGNPLAVLEYVIERPRNMSAWVTMDPVRVTVPEVYSLGPQDKGPHQASMVAQARMGDSKVTVTYTLRAGSSQLDVAIKVQWLERGGDEQGIPALRMRFPAALEDAKARYEIPFGSIQRNEPPGQEVPALRWAHLSGRGRGNQSAALAVLNDCKYGHSLDGSTLRVMLLRSSYNPDPLPEIGEHNIRLALVPSGGELSVADVTRMAAAVNHPLQVVGTGIHGGQIPPSAQLLSVEPASVVVTCVKRAEQNEDLIVRLLQTEPKSVKAKVRLNAQVLGSPASAAEVDLLERPLAEGSVALAGGEVSVRVAANGLASLKLSMKA